MNNGLLLGIFSKITDFIKEFFACLVDIIPKTVYFLFTAFSSAIDALQCLIRKLAGLDVYYSAVTGEAFRNTDPLSEFIMGILGIGNSAPTYKALNTVFWSLAIFAVIMLVVTTMIAMIKSHYNEDYQATNPWKYIYTAIKAVLTFALIPLVLVFGLKLSNFTLQTLDNITAGGASEEQVKAVYGTDAPQLFSAEKLTGADNKSYIYYDFFGYGSVTTSTPIGSMLFRSAAYDANRARRGLSYQVYQEIQSKGIQIFGNSNCQEFDSLSSNEERQEYVAYQIDYAFCNNLHLQSGVSINSIDDITDGHLNYMSALDIFRIGNDNLKSFTKYNVTAVWFFYNLWQFNFIVAFGGGITILGLLLSIIIGLMSRLIKGVALFMIYPPLLGLAPLDNFKAFKSWGTNMLQQVLMVFGSILGMNLMMLIIPYIQNISFFNIKLLDYIISVVILIVGLIMVKDFMALVSGFAGGADATAEGGKYKAEAADTLGKSTLKTGKMMLGGARVVGTTAVKAGRFAYKGVRGGIRTAKGVHASHQAKAINAYESTPLDHTIDQTLENVISGKEGKFVDAQAARAAKKYRAKLEKSGVTDENELNEKTKEAIEKSLKGQGKYKRLEKEQNKYSQDTSSLSEKQKQKYEKLREKGKELSERNAKGEFKGKLQRQHGIWGDAKFGEEGFWKTLGSGIKKGTGSAASAVGKGFKKTFYGEKDEDTDARKKGSSGLEKLGKKIGDGIDGVKLGKTIADSFNKSMGALTDGTGIDKMYKGLSDMFKTSLTIKGGVFDKDKGIEGDKLQKKIAEDQSKVTGQQTAILKEISKSMKDLKVSQQQGNQIQKDVFRAVQNNNAEIKAGNNKKDDKGNK